MKLKEVKWVSFNEDRELWTTRAKNQGQDTSFKIKSAELDGNKRDPDEKIE